ncbi:MFS transporter [Embleya sp. NPDC008237]|uniref:MFS transporter n=1 Tax=Embleya sp. NPDC008237 TaxID=3363978 RepID=UPI0036E5417B
MSATVEVSAKPPEPESDPSSVDTGRLEGVSKGRVLAVLAVVVMFSEVVPLQYAMISSAVPEIAPSFRSVGESITWMVVILGLVGGAVSPLIGKLSDVYGKKRLLLATSVSFLLGSLICALTSSWPLFLLGRALQAVAFGMTAVVYGLIRDLMPRKFIPVAIGVSATGLGLSAALAPVVGGVLTEHYSWRSLFWFLVVYMLVLIPLLLVVVPESKLRVPQKVDYVGGVILGVGLALILLYISQGQAWGWGKPSAFGYAVLGVVVIGLWVLWEKRVENPIIDLKLLTAPRVALVLGIAFLANMIIGIQNYLTSYMGLTPDNVKQSTLDKYGDGAVQGAKAMGAPEAMWAGIADQVKAAVSFNDSLDYALGFTLLGLALHVLIWQSMSSMIAGPLAGLWGQRRGLRMPMIVGVATLTVAGFMYLFLHDSWQLMLICGVVYGIGFGMYYAAAPNLIIEAVPQEQQGISSSMLVVAQSFGASVGVALLSPIFTNNRLQITGPSPTGQGMATVDACDPRGCTYTTDAFTTGFWILIVCGVLALVIALLMKHGRKPATGGLLH